MNILKHTVAITEKPDRQSLVFHPVDNLAVVPPRHYTLEACLNGDGNYRLILGRCYYFEKSKMNHTAAAHNCKDNHKGVLFEPRTISESDLIHHAVMEMNILPKKEDAVHIGINELKEEGKFVYDSSELPIFFENWRSGFGNRTTNDCVMISHLESPKWIDGNCNYHGPSICHVPIL